MAVVHGDGGAATPTRECSTKQFQHMSPERCTIMIDDREKKVWRINAKKRKEKKGKKREERDFFHQKWEALKIESAKERSRERGETDRG